ncbi:MAG: helix-turn-helix domain-containing protein [Treponema sp.]|jgi:transcriptional regulator with XRE-family HTH domain|nr:helix-turn-helix domain-containing protein [Treponema sp.]
MGFRENLKSQLQFSNMLVKELAARSGVKKKTIDSYLGAHGYTPSVEAALKIAQALGVSVEYLVTGREIEKQRPLSSLPQDVQEIVRAAERLPGKDRQIVFTLANSLGNRQNPV